MDTNGNWHQFDVYDAESCADEFVHNHIHGMSTFILMGALHIGHSWS